MSFFVEAGWTAKLVLGILIGFSLISWGIMLWKHSQLRKAKRQSEQFLDTFRKSTRFSEANAAAKMLKDSPLAGIFQAGYAEIDAQIKSRGNDPAEGGKTFQIRSLNAVERSLQRAIGVEILHLTRGNQFLATTAASTPFIGLFGTVWGIMVAFREIGLTGSTSIVTVAPGIAEALVNTAAGLGAAIPALIGFNHFANRLRRLRSRMEDFVMEFLNLAERNFT